MNRSGIQRRDYATGLVALFFLAIVLLPVGGVLLLGLLAPIWITALIVGALASMFKRT